AALAAPASRRRQEQDRRALHPAAQLSAAYAVEDDVRAAEEAEDDVLDGHSGDRPAQLLVEPDRLDAEGLARGSHVADVVTGGEHRQLVAGHRRLRQPLEERRLQAHRSERDVYE